MGRQFIEAEVTVDTVSLAGHGVGSFHAINRVHKAEIPHTIPGDRVRAQLGSQRKGWRQGRLLEVVEESPDRIVPRCRHVGDCGGCRWQQMDYGAQIRRKRSWIEGLYPEHVAIIGEVIRCDPPWNHRNKMEFTFSQERSGERFLGLLSPTGRGRVVDVVDCQVVSPWVMTALQAVRDWWKSTPLSAYHLHRNQGFLRTLTLREGIHTADKLALLTVAGGQLNEWTEGQKRSFVDCLEQAAGTISVVVRTQHSLKGSPTRFEHEVLCGSGFFFEELMIDGQKLRFRVSPTAFFQPNSKQAERLFTTCIHLAGIKPESRVLDLCCGTGTFSLIAGSRARRVKGIDCDVEAITDARENSRLNGMSHVEFEAGDVGQLMPRLILEEKWDVVIIDPPRAGIPKAALLQLLEARLPTIAYVSCNPRTQASDIECLMKGGYRLTRLVPIDQFPHTPHIETIAILQGGESVPV